MKPVFTIKQNDTGPPLGALLQYSDGTAINLDLCEVWFHMRSYVPGGDGTLKVDREATIVDATTGSVRYDWQAGDTDTVGMYRCEFEIRDPDGNITTVPNDGDFLVQVVQELG